MEIDTSGSIWQWMERVQCYFFISFCD